MTVAARWPLRSESAHSQLLRPSAQSQIWFPIRLLSIGILPLSK
jgi:hypothetical protein|tara:strand:+ start:317 stop:448 length:132 start_codon:yes stop_codon:yes gene_type:complete